MEKAYKVVVFDHFHLEDGDDFDIEGFPSFETAKEFARRRTRDSVEHLREEMRNFGREESREGLRRAWDVMGENVVAVGPGELYSAKDEVDDFIDNPASPEERDWLALDPRQGVQRDSDSTAKARPSQMRRWLTRIWQTLAR